MAITFDPAMEHHLTAALHQEGGELTLSLPAEMAVILNRKIAEAWKSAMDQGKDKTVLRISRDPNVAKRIREELLKKKKDKAKESEKKE